MSILRVKLSSDLSNYHYKMNEHENGVFQKTVANF